VWRYLKAAFWSRVPLPGLGEMPFNALAVAGFAILGFGHPGFWLLGLGLETAFLFSLASNKRFQRVVDARMADPPHSESVQEAQQRQTLILRLSLEGQEKLAALERSLERIADLYRTQGVDNFLASSNTEALHKLAGLYLRLLVARQNLSAADVRATGVQLDHQIEGLTQELKGDRTLSRTARKTKQATVEILRRRLQTLRRRDEAIEEVDSDLTRIEAQVALALDHATMRGQPEAISGRIELVSGLLESNGYGDLDMDVVDAGAAMAGRT